MSNNPLSKLLLPALAGVALALSGCATTSTPYQPASASNKIRGGYSDVQLASDRYRVTFEGNSLTSRDQVEGYLLYRSAELTLAQGYDGFSIVQRETEHRVERRIEPDPLYRPWYGSAYAYWQPEWRYYGRPYGWRSWYPYGGDPFWTSHIDVRTVEQFEATAEIVMHRGPKPDGNGKSFDARDVVAELGPKIERPKP
ncbi:CC0125/CC1285 family lipoprotein [Sphingopyxis chilensis]